MNDSSTGKTVDWKDRCFKCLLELEDKERAWSRTLATLETGLLHLARSVAPLNQDVANKLKLLDANTAGTSTSSIWTECIDDIVKTIGSGQSQADSPSPVMGTIANALLEMLDAIDVVEEAADELATVQNALASAPTPQVIASAIATVSKWIVRWERRHGRELQDSKRYLQRVSSELITLQEHISRVNGLQSESLTATAQLHEHIQLGVDTLRTHADTATNLDGIKAIIDAHLRDIQMNMKVFLEVERRRHNEAINANDALHKRLDELTDETERLRASLKETTARVYLDALTGIANRLAYDERIEQEHARLKRYGGRLSLIIVDIDRFKSINDDFGHSTGDALLKTLAAVLRQQLREVDFIARYGGEEFVILLPETALPNAATVAEKLRLTVENCRHTYQQSPFVATISCGLAEFLNGDTPDKVFQRADACLYAAKRAGRNRVAVDA